MRRSREGEAGSSFHVNVESAATVTIDGSEMAELGPGRGLARRIQPAGSPARHERRAAGAVPCLTAGDDAGFETAKPRSLAG
jgi:hypothetical protein